MRTIALDTPSIATGGYVGLLGYLVGTLAGLDGTGLQVGCGLVWLAVALVLGGRPALWVGAARRRLLAIPMLVPIGPMFALVLGAETGGEFDAHLVPLLSLVGLMILGLVIWTLGNRIYADRAAGELRASWVASPDAGRRRRVHAATLLVGATTAGAFVAAIYGFPISVLSGGIAAIIILQVSLRRTREYEACEHGLRYVEAGTVTVQFVPWERFDGLRETDDAVVLERRWWLDERMAGADVPEAAREALRAAVGDSSPTTQ